MELFDGHFNFIVFRKTWDAQGANARGIRDSLECGVNRLFTEMTNHMQIHL
jgi:hypothetical protein